MKNYFIAGGSSGIGNALAHQLSGEGHRVYATFCRNSKTEEGNISYHQLDVLNGAMDLEYLPPVLDGFVYCVGSINLLPFTRIKPDDFVRDYQLQVVGAIRLLQSILPRLKMIQGSSIVLFSTVAVQQGFNFHTQVASSKGAIEGLTRSLAAELAPGIRVNAIAPSITDTPLASRLLNTEDKRDLNAQRHPLKKIGAPNDIAAFASYLLDSRSAWITGQVFKIDGGISGIK